MPEEGYHLTEDLVDKAIGLIADSKQVAPGKPFFMYFFAPAPMHAPHHVPKEWADRYKEKFDAGWKLTRKEVFEGQEETGGCAWADAELSRHDPDVQSWDTLSADEETLYARMMEVFAGFLTHTDHHIRSVDPVFEKAWGIGQHLDHGALGQRRQFRGRAAGDDK